MSETTPLNEWPLDELVKLEKVVMFIHPMAQIYNGTDGYKEILSVIQSAIKDAEEKLNELPFK